MVRWIAGSMDCWFDGSLVQRFDGSVVQWFACSMDRWFDGSMDRWFDVGYFRETYLSSEDEAWISCHFSESFHFCSRV